jgi:hypothetical protein
MSTEMMAITTSSSISVKARRREARGGSMETVLSAGPGKGNCFGFARGQESVRGEQGGIAPMLAAEASEHNPRQAGLLAYGSREKTKLSPAVPERPSRGRHMGPVAVAH